MKTIVPKEGKSYVFMDKGKPMVYSYSKGNFNLIGEMIMDPDKHYYEGDRFFP